ncbi:MULTISPECIES: hypothetical protein [unclassified Rhodococcus (in: high G+C Gram-positive bacteria)]|uniref:hypothetical protein n=1 Tax=unclassified Rhodococcus (in: high G+C Gram-positive bacteria) TaxID=192944 RepID=UPI00096A65B7|nr:MULTISPECIES: hypothetical protein [unclassified Rhodococcus (in: high G+C Gram-positive bacteria)]
MKVWLKTTGLDWGKKYGPWVGGFVLAFIAGMIGSAITSYGIGTAEFWDVAAQPIATATAGVLAIGAATIAFLGVRYAQKVAISTAKAQLRQQGLAQNRQAANQQALVDLQLDAQRAQVKQHNEQMSQQEANQINQGRQSFNQITALHDIERDKHRRQVTFDALVRANRALVDLQAAFVLIDKAITEDKSDPIQSLPSKEDVARDVCVARLSDCVDAASLLLLLDVQEPYKAILEVTQFVRERMAFQRGIEMEIHQVQKFSEVWTLAVGSLVGKYDTIGERT